ncbi:hypothetical protein GCK32_006875 [Trichostrongylus colubriformis]|uniref:Uncharacterized protein n=1 Tax=Trichostrongylus colubriformis TaxID=6319 RepID=A0AAN8FLA0_TRICO
MSHRSDRPPIEKMKTLILFGLCFCRTAAEGNGFEMAMEMSPPDSTSDNQSQDIQAASCSACPSGVLDSSAIPVESPSASESPPVVGERPTNGFWPNPEAVRMFLGRQGDQLIQDRLLTASPARSILVHHAIYPQYRPVNGIVTNLDPSEGLWDVHPNPAEFVDPNSVIIQTLPKPDIPLNVVVHLISEGMGEGSGGGGGADETATALLTPGDERPSFVLGAPEDVIREAMQTDENLTLVQEEAGSAQNEMHHILQDDQKEHVVV